MSSLVKIIGVECDISCSSSYSLLLSVWEEPQHIDPAPPINMPRVSLRLDDSLLDRSLPHCSASFSAGGADWGSSRLSFIFLLLFLDVHKCPPLQLIFLLLSPAGLWGLVVLSSSQSPAPSPSLLMLRLLSLAKSPGACWTTVSTVWHRTPPCCPRCWTSPQSRMWHWWTQSGVKTEAELSEFTVITDCVGLSLSAFCLHTQV